MDEAGPSRIDLYTAGNLGGSESDTTSAIANGAVDLYLPAVYKSIPLSPASSMGPL